MSTTAKLFAEPLPDLVPGAQLFTVDCPFGTTRLTWIPGGGLNLSERHMISILLQRHEAECGCCDLAPLWREHGDLELKAESNRRCHQLRTYRVAGRRN